MSATNFEELNRNQRAARGGGRRPRDFTALVKVAGYHPAEAADMKTWTGRGHKDDRMSVVLMHDVPGLKAFDGAGEPVVVKARLIDHDNAAKHNVIDMAKGREGKPAMTPKNDPILKIEGTYNPSTNEIEVKWMNRIHAKYDPAGASAYVGNYMSVRPEGKGKNNDGQETTWQTRRVALIEQGLPLSMFGAPADEVVNFTKELGAVEEGFLPTMKQAIEDFQSNDRDRVVSALTVIATQVLKSVDGLPGTAEVVIRGMDAKGAGASGTFRRPADKENNYAPIPIEQAVKEGLESKELQGLIDFATANPQAYWDAFPTMALRTGGNTLPSRRKQSDLKEGRVREDWQYSDHTQFLTMSAPRPDGKTYPEVGYSIGVMGVGRNLENDVETGESSYVGSFYGMNTYTVERYATSYALEILPTDYMPEEVVKAVHAVAAERQKAYAEFRKEQRAEAENKNEGPAPESNDAAPDLTNTAQSSYGMG